MEVVKDNKIFNKDLYRFRQGFDSLANIDSSAQFAFKIIKNLRLIQAEIDDFNKLLTPSEDYIKKYQTKVEEIAKEFCIKDENGNPKPRIGQNGQAMYDFSPANKILFDKAVEEFDKLEENVEIVQIRKDQLEKYNSFMEEPSELKLSRIPANILPEKITPSQLDFIYELVNE